MHRLYAWYKPLNTQQGPFQPTPDIFVGDLWEKKATSHCGYNKFFISFTDPRYAALQRLHGLNVNFSLYFGLEDRNLAPYGLYVA